MVISILVPIAIGISVSLLILYFKLPIKIQYIEEVTINTSVSKVYDAIRYQEQLMEWSAWPAATKSQCAVKNVDGQIGVQTVYLKKGKQFGYQEVTHLKENESISFYLSSKVPFEQDTRLHFYLKEINTNMTSVSLYFDNTLKRPSHMFPHLFGIVKWTYHMHLKDLAGLKKYTERTE